MFGLPRRSDPAPWDDRRLIRADLFDAEDFDRHAGSLARAQAIARRPIGRAPLSQRLADNQRVLAQAHRKLAQGATRGERQSAAGEWFLDNYHLVEEQLRVIQADLPPGFYRRLPKLAEGPLTGYPRVFGIAWACVAHTDSRLRAQTLRRFVSAYQEVQPLEIGELWAFAISLRVVLIENLRRAAVLIVERPAGIVEQAACNVTVRNIITALRSLSDVNWPEFVESVSLIDQRLREVSGFQAMDFATRNLYRAEIEELSRQSKSTELQVTAELIRRLSLCPKDQVRERDPGFYLLREGRRSLERALHYRPARIRMIRRGILAAGAVGYISAMLVLSAVVLLIPLVILWAHALGPFWLLILGVFGAVPASDVAVSLLNRALTGGLTAQILPGLALRDGVPASMRTLVVVPTLLTNREAIEQQLERLEVHYVASAKGELHFALLSDWLDADAESMPGDDELLQRVTAGVARLNRLYGPTGHGARFYVFHRRRVWSEGQARWIGWERKRGKLHELNRLLRGAADTTFIATSGAAIAVPEHIRFVVTLDADTRLPRQTIQRLVGKLAHPLNQAVQDGNGGPVVDGYAILQPRVTPSMPVGHAGSIFQRVYSSMAGIDPYAAAVSDVYQDLTGDGSYAGKGIYDVDAFEAALTGRIPEASMLSHDLFEGSYARAGLVSDIEVVEDFPERYDVAAMRSHRWARGDWQLLPWILSSSSLSLMGRWKMLDNLRRTLSAPACVVALLAGWLLPLPLACVWTAFLVLCIVGPPFLSVFVSALPVRVGVAPHSHWRAFRRDARLALTQATLNLCFLAHQAALMTDAIIRTLYRLTISRRNLLEWVTAAQAQVSAHADPFSFYRRMSPSLAIPVIAAAAVFGFSRPACWLALPFLLAWSIAPALARFISEDRGSIRATRVSPDDAGALRLVARRTWRYFETFVTADDHQLPPDNFQEDPEPVVAHRTSPTNIGLYLLSIVSARDFGWIGTAEAAARIAATVGSMHRLPRFRGHLYNWYDTRSLVPMEPSYISSVDSGNLAAHLIAVANACREWVGEPLDVMAASRGIDDAVGLALDSLRRICRSHYVPVGLRDGVEEAARSLSRVLTRAVELAATPADWLQECERHAARLVESAQRLARGSSAEVEYGNLIFWANAALESARSWAQDAGQSESALLTLNQRLVTLEIAARELAFEMDFEFLVDPERRLLAIGYRTVDESLDPSCYDLLASEARLASFFAIAKNDVPTSHWFRLGRALTPVGMGAALISWSGSMFEYLMPTLVLREPMGSLLEQTSRLIVRHQIESPVADGSPWGVSESAYYERNQEFTYQYSNFGIPDLGLKRGLADNAVVAPYATGLASMFAPAEAVRNFRQLDRLGALGPHGFYEALDYTPSRLPAGQAFAIVRAFMAHHQGMTVCAIANAIFDGRLRSRFHADLNVQATELLLQERAPRDVAIVIPRASELPAPNRWSNSEFVSPRTPVAPPAKLRVDLDLAPCAGDARTRP